MKKLLFTLFLFPLFLFGQGCKKGIIDKPVNKPAADGTAIGGTPLGNHIGTRSLHLSANTVTDTSPFKGQIIGWRGIPCDNDNDTSRLGTWTLRFYSSSLRPGDFSDSAYLKLLYNYLKEMERLYLSLLKNPRIRATENQRGL